MKHFIYTFIVFIVVAAAPVWFAWLAGFVFGVVVLAKGTDWFIKGEQGRF